jgi:hypothetical protein
MKKYLYIIFILLIGCSNHPKVDDWYEKIQDKTRWKIAKIDSQKECVKLLHSMYESLKSISDSLEKIDLSKLDRESHGEILQRRLLLTKEELKILQTPYNPNDSLKLHVIITNESDYSLLTKESLMQDFVLIKK